MKLTLDRTRDFGSVFPPEQLLCFDGKAIAHAAREEDPSAYARFIAMADGDHHVRVRCYEQDGFSFDAAGEIIAECLDSSARKRAMKAEAEKAAALAARIARDRVMADHGFGPERLVTLDPRSTAGLVSATDVGSNPADGADGATADGTNMLDIAACLDGRLNVQWFAVKKALREQHGRDFPDKASAREWMVGAGLMPASIAV